MSSIKLTWQYGGSVDYHNIYRSITPMSLNSLPEPLVTGIIDTTYTDSNLIYGQLYYYRISNVKDGIEKISYEIARYARYNDEYFENVVSLLHFDNEIKDEKNLMWTLQGSPPPIISTNDKMFGDSSLYISTTSNSSQSSINNGFNFVASDKFTIEFYFKRTATPNSNGVMIGITNSDATTDTRWAFFVRSNDNIAVYNSTNSTFIDVPTNTTLAGKWVHYAFVKDGTSNKLFINGIMLANAAQNTVGYNNCRIHLGWNGQNQNETFSGYIDELRITKGVARYSSNFTPPTTPYPND